MCSLGIESTTFRSADAMFYHWATQKHILISYKKLIDEKCDYNRLWPTATVSLVTGSELLLC